MRIAIVNDLQLATEAIRRVVAGEPAHQVAWIARDGAEAVQRCAADRPDLILMDLIMPVMDGVEATRRIMAATPCPILVVTATVDGNCGPVYNALGAGALDAVNTPTLLGPKGAAGAAALLEKIDVIRRLTGAGNETSSVPPWSRPAPPVVDDANGAAANGARAAACRCLIAIGASAGGPVAVAELLKTFPVDLPAAVVVIQHIDESFAAGMAEWLGTQIALPVRLARDREALAPGVVLLSARADHLVITPGGSIAYTAEPVEAIHRPSVDVFFESVARNWRQDAAGVILTGMGRDGARGLKQMRERGFITIAQDRASSAVYGMPKAAAEIGAAGQILPLADIGAALRKSLNRS